MRLIDDLDGRFNVGVPAMDRTHRELFDLLNRMAEASDAAFAYLYPDLVNHTHAHFANEEVLMRQSDFPGGAAHIADHRAILTELESHRHCERGEPLRRARAFITERLPVWCETHLTGFDRALAEHLKAVPKGRGKG